MIVDENNEIGPNHLHGDDGLCATKIQAMARGYLCRRDSLLRFCRNQTRSHHSSHSDGGLRYNHRRVSSITMSDFNDSLFSIGSSYNTSSQPSTQVFPSIDELGEDAKDVEGRLDGNHLLCRGADTTGFATNATEAGTASGLSSEARRTLTRNNFSTDPNHIYMARPPRLPHPGFDNDHSLLGPSFGFKAQDDEHEDSKRKRSCEAHSKNTENSTLLLLDRPIQVPTRQKSGGALAPQQRKVISSSPSSSISSPTCSGGQFSKNHISRFLHITDSKNNNMHPSKDHASREIPVLDEPIQKPIRKASHLDMTTIPSSDHQSSSIPAARNHTISPLERHNHLFRTTTRDPNIAQWVSMSEKQKNWKGSDTGTRKVVEKDKKIKTLSDDNVDDKEKAEKKNPRSKTNSCISPTRNRALLLQSMGKQISPQGISHWHSLLRRSSKQHQNNVRTRHHDIPLPFPDTTTTMMTTTTGIPPKSSTTTSC